MCVWQIMSVFVYVKDCDLYGPVTGRVYSYLEAIQLASSCMLDHVRGSALSDGQISGLEGHLCVCVCLSDSRRLKRRLICPFCSLFESSFEV